MTSIENDTSTTPDIELYVFDFDGTITTKDTFALFLRYFAGTGRWILNLTLLLPVFIGYLIKLTSRDAVKAHVIRRFFKNVPKSDIEEKAKDFAQTIIPNLIRPEALKHLKQRQNSPYTLYICSASIGPYLRHWGKTHGIDNILATELESRHGVCTGEISGWNIWGPGKTRRIFAEFEGQQVLIKEAYGDSRGDLELLNAAEASFWKPFRV
ncbi:MAG: HAD-IB family hydrolase [Maricaulaceae bacterium]